MKIDNKTLELLSRLDPESILEVLIRLSEKNENIKELITAYDKGTQALEIPTDDEIETALSTVFLLYRSEYCKNNPRLYEYLKYENFLSDLIHVWMEIFLEREMYTEVLNLASTIVLLSELHFQEFAGRRDFPFFFELSKDVIKLFKNYIIDQPSLKRQKIFDWLLISIDNDPYLPNRYANGIQDLLIVDLRYNSICDPESYLFDKYMAYKGFFSGATNISKYKENDRYSLPILDYIVMARMLGKPEETIDALYEKFRIPEELREKIEDPNSPFLLRQAVDSLNVVYDPDTISEMEQSQVSLWGRMNENINDEKNRV